MKCVICKASLLIWFLSFLYIAKGQGNSLQIDSLKKVLLTEKEDTNKVNTLNALSRELNKNNEITDAIQYAKTALTIADNLTDKKGADIAYRRIGQAFENQENYQEAEKNYASALQISKETGDKKDMADLYDKISFIEINYTGNYSDALKNSFFALKLREEIGDKKGIADALQSVGADYFQIGNNYPLAMKYTQLSMNIRKEIGDKEGIANSYRNIGWSYNANDKLSEALKNFLAAYNLYKESGNKTGIAFTYQDIGQTFEAIGDSAKAAGNEEAATDNYIKAVNNYSNILKFGKETADKHWLMSSYMYLGSIDIKLKQYKEAKSYLEKGSLLANQNQIKDALAVEYDRLSILDSALGNYKQAYENYKLYILYRDSLNNDEVTKKTVQTQMQYDFDKKESAAKAFQDKKDEEEKREKNQQYYTIASLGIVVLAVVVIALLQFRINKHKQRANIALQQQKEKVESTLTELKATQAQLIQSEKMASLGELTAGIAHEIQNPLNFVNNFSEINNELIDEMNAETDVEEIKAIANDIKQNNEKINYHGKRADAIVKGMLQHSRKNTGQKEQTDINALCDEYLRLSYHGLRAKDKNFNSDFKTDFDKSIGKINIVLQDMGRVLLNLFTNAFYAVNEKKKLMDNSYQPSVTISTKTIKNKIEITITDNGNGIPKNIIDKIFQPFFTTKPTGEGTGLGLSLSYDIITKEHSGTITVESEENCYTRFIITLPA